MGYIDRDEALERAVKQGWRVLDGVSEYDGALDRWASAYSPRYNPEGPYRPLLLSRPDDTDLVTALAWLLTELRGSWLVAEILNDENTATPGERVAVMLFSSAQRPLVAGASASKKLPDETAIEIARLHVEHWSDLSIARDLNKRGIRAARGGDWTAAQVRKTRQATYFARFLEQAQEAST